MLSDESEAARLPAVTADEKKSVGTEWGRGSPLSDKPGLASWPFAARCLLRGRITSSTNRDFLCLAVTDRIRRFDLDRHDLAVGEWLAELEIR